MRILFLGDVMGRAGRDGIAARLPALKARFAPEIVIVNAENAAAGHGITLKIAASFFDLGIACLTTGNHVWNQREMIAGIEQEPRILRPFNYPQGTPGQGVYVPTLPDGRTIAVANIMGNLFMHDALDDPFAAGAALASSFQIGKNVTALFIDFHAEATSEKMAFAQFMDGRASAVVGTHTHIPTADAHILSGGTAYQTDAGMCGAFDSVIGMKKERSIWRFTKKIPGERMEPAEGEASLCGCFIETDDATGLARKIEAFQVGGQLERKAL